jgi:winged helix DNA-binding protein
MRIPAELVEQRRRNQRLVASACRTAEDVVAWLGAVQAQDFAGAKWAIGQRTAGLTDDDVERAFNEGRILRTHVMRPTWHFVAPADIRWMLELSAPRLQRTNRLHYRRSGLDGRTLVRAHRALERTLAGGQALTRTELAAALGRARVPAAGERLAYVMMHAELERLVCSGPRRGKQFTYMLLDERVAAVAAIDREAALAGLSARYFASHGPATARDFCWWSGLTARDAVAGLDAVKTTLQHVELEGCTYWFVPSRSPSASRAPWAHLFPNYDEFLIAYRDRELVRRWPHTPGRAAPRDAYVHQLVVDGRLRGSWQRTAANGGVRINVRAYSPLSRRETTALAAAASRFGRFYRTQASASLLE